MNLNGAIVKHATFGEGTILDLTSNYLSIGFAEGKKTFLYPAAFCKHITAVDPEIAAFIKTEVAAYQTSAATISENIRLQRINMQNARKDTLQKAAATPKARKKKVAKVEGDAPVEAKQ